MTEVALSDINNPLYWFEELIQNGGTTRCYEKFLLDQEMLTGDSTPNNSLEFFIHEQDENGAHIYTKVSFEDYLEKEFRKAYRKTIGLLSNYLAAFNSAEDFKVRITQCLNTIQYLFNRSGEILSYGQERILDKWITKLIKFIKEKYGNIISTHPLYDLLGIESESEAIVDIFGFKKGTKTIEKLYYILVELDFFAQDTDQYDTFKKVLTSIPASSNIKLIVACDNQRAAYILKQLDLFFRNLKYKSIDKSKIFINKQRKPFNANDLSKAKSNFLKNRDKHEELIEKIDTALSKIK